MGRINAELCESRIASSVDDRTGHGQCPPAGSDNIRYGRKATLELNRIVLMIGLIALILIIGMALAGSDVPALNDPPELNQQDVLNGGKGTSDPGNLREMSHVACYQNPDCRLDTPPQGMIDRFQSGNWTLNKTEGVDGATIYTATHYEGEISIVWVDDNGVSSIHVLVSPPPATAGLVPVPLEAAVREVTTVAIPQPWGVDIPNRIINEWYFLRSRPPEYRGPLNSHYNGVAVQTSYSRELPGVAVLFRKRMATEGK